MTLSLRYMWFLQFIIFFSKHCISFSKESVTRKAQFSKCILWHFPLFYYFWDTMIEFVNSEGFKVQGIFLGHCYLRSVVVRSDENRCYRPGDIGTYEYVNCSQLHALILTRSFNCGLVFNIQRRHNLYRV